MNPTSGPHTDADVRLTPSFDPFAATCAPRLMLTSWVLLGDREDARRVVRGALGRVRHEWTDLGSANEAEIRARQVSLRRARQLRRHRTGRSSRHGDDDLPDPVLWRAVARLPRRSGWIVVLHYVDEIPLTDVAAVVGVSADSLTGQFSTAIVQLQRRLTEAPETGHGGAPADGAAGSIDSQDIDPAGDDNSEGDGDSDDDDLGLAEPVEEQQRRDALDARLRDSAAALRARSPGDQEVREIIRGLDSPGSRLNVWTIAAAVTVVALLAIPVVRWLGGDDGGDADDAAAASSTPGDEPVTLTTEPPETTTAPTTEADDGAESANVDAIERTVRIDVTDGRADAVQYHPESGFLLTTTEWDWDDDGGACVGISRQRRRPTPEAIDPTVRNACVPGARSDVTLTARFGTEIIELSLTSAPGNPWHLRTEPTQFPEGCERPRRVPSLEVGDLYELACRGARTQVRRFPRTTVGDALHLETMTGDTVTAERVADGAQLDDWGGPDATGPDVEAFRVDADSPAGNSTPCVLVVVAEAAGWREACGELDGRGVLSFAEQERPYLVGYDDGGVQVLRGSGAMNATAIGCAGTLVDVLTAGDALGMWSSFGCDGITGTGTRPPTAVSVPPGDPRHEWGVIWVGEDRGRTVTSASGRPTISKWAEVSRRLDRDEAWRCGALAPCGGTTVLPIASDMSSWGPDITVFDVTEDARDAARGVTDPGSIAVRVFDQLVGGEELTSGPDRNAYSMVDGTVYRLRGTEYRWIGAVRFGGDASSPHIVGVWAVRPAGSEAWSVAAAFSLSECTAGPKSSCET